MEPLAFDQGIIERDEVVFQAARERKVPLLMVGPTASLLRQAGGVELNGESTVQVTSGGYQRNNARIIADSILNLSRKQLISAKIS